MLNPPKLSSIKLTSFLIILPFTFVFTLVSGCSKPTPVPKSQCNSVVSHAQKILGKNAPSSYDMLKQCGAADDDARGCVMAADKPMKILKCDF
jgi:hypothetical protein